MWKNVFATAILISMFAFGNSFCSASDTFQTIYDANAFSEDMKNNEARSEKFNTPYGEMKFQMRKLWTDSDKDKMNVIIWLGDKRIYESKFPRVEFGYTFKAIKDSATNRQFFVLQSIERALLMGYSPENQKMEIYIDSLNYYHNFEAYPYIGALKNGDLILAFEQINVGKQVPLRQRYRFTWDAKSNWFSYRDLGLVGHSIAQDMQN